MTNYFSSNSEFCFFLQIPWNHSEYFGVNWFHEIFYVTVNFFHTVFSWDFTKYFARWSGSVKISWKRICHVVISFWFWSIALASHAESGGQYKVELHKISVKSTRADFTKYLFTLRYVLWKLIHVLILFVLTKITSYFVKGTCTWIFASKRNSSDRMQCSAILILERTIFVAV